MLKSCVTCNFYIPTETMLKSCVTCNFYIPTETTCLIKYNLGRTFEIEAIKNALSYGKCDEYKSKPKEKQ